MDNRTIIAIDIILLGASIVFLGLALRDTTERVEKLEKQRNELHFERDYQTDLHNRLCMQAISESRETLLAGCDF